MHILRKYYENYFSDMKNPILSFGLAVLRWIYRTRFIQFLVFSGWESDARYIRRTYRDHFGLLPDLENPRNFNEKNNWRKLHDRKAVYTRMVDKYLFKLLVKERVGEEYTFPLLGHWDRPEDIDFDRLPEQFVLKPNHSGGVLICRDKKTFDQKRAIRLLKKAMKVNYFIHSREWPYKDVKRCVIAEAYMGENLCDFKNYCFNGKLLYTLVWKNVPHGDGKPKASFCGMYDRDWKKTDMELCYPSIPSAVIEKPLCYDEMVRVAETMAKDTIFVRCDFFIINGRPYMGEMTFFPWGGFQQFKDEKWNRHLGDLEQLPFEK